MELEFFSKHDNSQRVVDSVVPTYTLYTYFKTFANSFKIFSSFYTCIHWHMQFTNCYIGYSFYQVPIY